MTVESFWSPLSIGILLVALLMDVVISYGVYTFLSKKTNGFKLWLVMVSLFLILVVLLFWFIVWVGEFFWW